MATVASGNNAPAYFGILNVGTLPQDEGVQPETIPGYGDQEISAPLFHLLDKPYEKCEVFSVNGNPIAIPDGPMWSIEKTVGRQDLLTIWDMGCVHVIVPKSTVDRTGQSWQRGSHIAFIAIDSSPIAPLGICLEFAFKIQNHCFVRKAYVVECACFQLLLGTNFLWEVGASLFPRWAQIIITIPKEITIKASCVGVRVTLSPKQLESKQVDLDDIVDINFGSPERVVTSPVTTALFAGMQV